MLQIPERVSILELHGGTKVPLRVYTPEKIIEIRKVIVNMFIRGCVSQDFTMKLNVLQRDENGPILISSNTISNLELVRDVNWYCWLRFDFPDLKNLFVIGHQYLLQFELSDEYLYDKDNYIGLIICHDSPLAIMNPEKTVIRISDFFEQI